MTQSSARLRVRCLLPSKAVLALAGVLLAAGCAAPQGAQPQPQRSGGLPAILRDLQEHPERRLAGEAVCEYSIKNNPSDFPYEAFFSGLFDTSEEAAGRAFCAALVEAAVAGDFSEEDLATFRKGGIDHDKAPLGALLRKLIVAHERLQGQQVQRPSTVIPATAS